MQKGSSKIKKQMGVATAGHDIVRFVAGLAVGNPLVEDPLPLKNRAVVPLGRMGGLKGDKAGKKRYVR